MPIVLVFLPILAVLMWVSVLIAAIRYEEGSNKIAWAVAIGLMPILGAVVYVIYRSFFSRPKPPQTPPIVRKVQVSYPPGHAPMGN
jgi:Phospholipase_D-nuclease N-terminal